MLHALHPTRSSRRQQKTGRRWRLPTGWVLILIVIAVIAGCALPAPFAGAATETETIATDNGLFTATYAAPGSNVRAALTREEAISRAAGIISGTEQASGVRAREVLLTLESATGQMTTQGRHTWLVTYEGRRFELSEGCSCYQQTYANTTVVLDAQTGQTLLVFGSERT